MNSEKQELTPTIKKYEIIISGCGILYSNRTQNVWQKFEIMQYKINGINEIDNYRYKLVKG